MSSRFRVIAALAVGLIMAVFMGNPVNGQNENPGAPAKTIVAKSPGDQLNFDSVPVNAMIDLLEQLTGKRYIRDENLQGIPPVTVHASGLGKDEAAKLITDTLLLNGVAVLPVDDHTMQVITTGTNKNPRSEGVRTYTSEADLPSDNQIVTYFMPLDHISPEEAAGIFTQVAPAHVYGAYVPAVSANAIILTENVSVIRELIALKKGIDARSAAPPRPAPPGAPGQGPRPEHPHPPIGGLVILTIVLVLASAAGNFLAHLWLGRSKGKQAS